MAILTGKQDIINPLEFKLITKNIFPIQAICFMVYVSNDINNPFSIMVGKL